MRPEGLGKFKKSAHVRSLLFLFHSVGYQLPCFMEAKCGYLFRQFNQLSCLKAVRYLHIIQHFIELTAAIQIPTSKPQIVL
jgi:hypothetical protein